MCHDKLPQDAEFPCIVTDRRGQGNGISRIATPIVRRGTIAAQDGSGTRLCGLAAQAQPSRLQPCGADSCSGIRRRAARRNYSMPTCEKCQSNEASVRLDAIVNGQRESHVFCQQCAEEVMRGAM